MYICNNHLFKQITYNQEQSRMTDLINWISGATKSLVQMTITLIQCDRIYRNEKGWTNTPVCCVVRHLENAKMTQNSSWSHITEAIERLK